MNKIGALPEPDADRSPLDSPTLLYNMVVFKKTYGQPPFCIFSCEATLDNTQNVTH